MIMFVAEIHHVVCIHHLLDPDSTWTVQLLQSRESMSRDQDILLRGFRNMNLDITLRRRVLDYIFSSSSAMGIFGKCFTCPDALDIPSYAKGTMLKW